MKLTEDKLRKIIKEEAEKLNESTRSISVEDACRMLRREGHDIMGGSNIINMKAGPQREIKIFVEKVQLIDMG